IMTPRGRAIVTGYSLAMGTAFGTILTGCGLLAYRRWKGDTFYPSRAGHWLLLLGLAAAPADVTAVRGPIPPAPPGPPPPRHALPGAIPTRPWRVLAGVDSPCGRLGRGGDDRPGIPPGRPRSPRAPMAHGVPRVLPRQCNPGGRARHLRDPLALWDRR